MWKTFQHHDSLYMIKPTQEEDLSFYLTDLQTIWIQTSSQESLLQDFQNSNCLFDVKANEAVDVVVNLISEISEKDEINLEQNEDELILNLKSVKAQFSIEFRFKFTKAATDVFLREVTVPLIQTVQYLETSKNVLRSLLQKKDRELEEYKLEKGLISREDLITEKFEETMLGSIDNKSMMNVFGSSTVFWEAFTKKYGHLKTTAINVRVDPWNHIKRKRKVYSSKTTIKKGKGINYSKNE